MLHAPGFAIAAVLTLGLGIGVTTIVFSIVNGLLLRPLPYGDRSDRLVTLHSTHPTETARTQMDDAGVSYADAMDFRAATRSFDGIELVGTRSVSLASATDSERVAAAAVTPGLFRMLGVSPGRGRDFEDADGALAGFEQVAIISDGLWKRLYGADPQVVGKTVLMNGRALTIAGVMPPRFDFPAGQQIWLPYRQERGVWRERRGDMLGVGLLAEGASMRQAREELNAIAATLAAEYPDTNRDWSAHVAPMRDLFVTGGIRNSVTTMFAAVGLLLLAACANIAGLLVARGIGRQRELTVRAALGARRADLVRVLFAESAIVAAAGGVAGVLVAAWGLRALLGSMYEPPPAWAMPEVNGAVLGFAALASGVSALAAGLLPAWRVSRVRTVGSLGAGARSAGPTADQRRLRAVIVGRRLAERLWPDGSAVERVLHVRDQTGRQAHRVVGVSPDLVYEELGEETEQSQVVLYVPHASLPYRTLAALLRVDGDPASVLQPAHAAVRAVDPSFAAFDTLTMANRRNATLWGERFVGSTFGLFAVMALLLACLGTYGLTAYSAAQRAREIGVRLAIGATRVQILRLLLARGARLAVAGALAGLPIAALAARGMRGMLYEMSPWGPVLWLSLPLVILGAVVVASYVPAHRASGADPARALRAD